MIAVRIAAKGGWIEVTYDGTSITMAAVGPPLRLLTAEPKNLLAKQQQNDARGRYRRMALDALENAGAADSVVDADLVWSHRAG